ncbi:MAG: hypothetical protein JXA93_17005 [Anaerolineae bacterium]|nr:hypothetical protein [Anaerolineae bacterium]
MVDRHPWSEDENRADEEKVIPWAEGNGLWAAVARVTSDLAAVDVITFFAQNPYAMDNAQSIAERIGRRLESVAPILESLAHAGFVDRLDLDGVVIYQMNTDPRRQQTLQQYVTWLQEAYHWARLVMTD